MNLSLLLLGNLFERASTRVAALDGGVELDLGLAPLPAEENELAVEVSGKVYEPGRVILQQDAERANPLEVLPEGGMEVVPLSQEPEVPLPVREVRGREAIAPIRLEVLDEVVHLLKPEGAGVHLVENSIDRREEAGRFLDGERLRWRGGFRAQGSGCGEGGPPVSASPQGGGPRGKEVF